MLSECAPGILIVDGSWVWYRLVAFTPVLLMRKACATGEVEFDVLETLSLSVVYPVPLAPRGAWTLM